MSRCVDEAFQLAKQHGKMNLFAEIIDGQGNVDDKLATQEDYRSIALYFESERNSLQAGRYVMFWSTCVLKYGIWYKTV